MTRIAILGGGISGLTAAYELELARRAGAPVDWHLYEASDRLGGIVETTRHTTPEGDFILEGGPDAWVSERPWARDLAIELGLESDLIYSNDATRRTYILQPNPGEAGKANPAGRLVAIPDRMRLMVPEDLTALENSPLFTPTARAAYAAELANAEHLKSASPFADAAHDESVATFVLRHFGKEVLTKLAAPLLSGVFGGDVAKLSARAVMPQFVAMERDHGSLIAGLQAKAAQRTQQLQPIFTSLRSGMGSLIEALVATLPPERLHLRESAHELSFDEDEWDLWIPRQGRAGFQASGSLSAPPTTRTVPTGPFDSIVLATSLAETRRLLFHLDLVATTFLPSSGSAPSLLPTNASSAILATFVWPAEAARTFTILPGFGFLVPNTFSGPHGTSKGHDFSRAETAPTGVGASAPEVRLTNPPGTAQSLAEPQLLAGREPRLLACTFVDQKFPHRAPSGARILRAFFGGPSAETLTTQSDETIAAAALTQLRQILGPIPEPSLITVRRWPRSLPQYEIGHLARMAQLDALIAQLPGLHLLGNSYRGVGLPDLIHAARTTARSLISNH